MKRSSIVLIILLLGISSCKDYSVKTIVNEDGSIEKIVRVSSRDRIDNLSDLLFNIDDSWEISRSKDSSTSTHTLTAKRKFKSVSELIDEYGSPQGVVIEVNLAEKFRWFYTYYVYEEIIESTNPFTAIKVEDYLNESEYKELSGGGQISEELSDKLNEYLQASAFKELLTNLSNLFAEKGIDTDRLYNSRDKLSGIFEDDSEIDFLLGQLKEIYSPETVTRVEDEITKVYNDLERKAEKIFGNVGSEFTYNIELPGLILETNAQSIEGSAGYWKFDTENFTYVDYTMHIESRKANIITMTSTAVLFILLLGLLLWPVYRKRQKSAQAV